MLSSFGCSGTTATGCDAIQEPTPRVECRIEALQPAVDDYPRLELELSNLQDDAEHDLVALRLMVQHPSLFPILCPRIRTSAARERCARLEERPHLSERAKRPAGGPPQ